MRNHSEYFIGGKYYPTFGESICSPHQGYILKLIKDIRRETVWEALTSPYITIYNNNLLLLYIYRTYLLLHQRHSSCFGKLKKYETNH